MDITVYEVSLFTKINIHRFIENIKCVNKNLRNGRNKLSHHSFYIFIVCRTSHNDENILWV